MDSAVAGLVLAAGAGRRYGTPKALVTLDGSLLVERAARTLAAGGCDPVTVVLGAAADDVLARADLGPVRPVRNPDWATGMGSSLRAGLAALPAGCDAVLVLLVDTPHVTAGAVARLRAVAAPDALAAASYAGRRGHPVLLGRDHWPGVAALAVGDTGARPYLARHDVTAVDCTGLGDDTDLDVPPAPPRPAPHG
ncbi:MAG TPA: nucleotidyltransferase family protein [Actinocatenispora sp.]